MPEPPPPWRLVSDAGVLHHVRSEEALVRLCRATPGMKLGNIKQLLGIQINADGTRSASHERHGWRDYPCIPWLVREYRLGASDAADSLAKIEYIPVLGNTQSWLSEFASKREDMQQLCANKEEAVRFIQGNQRKKVCFHHMHS